MLKLLKQVITGFIIASCIAVSPIATAFSIQYKKEVNDLMKNLNSKNIWDTVTALTSYPDRNANSTYKNKDGLTADVLIKNKIAAMISRSERQDVSMYTMPAPPYKQVSIIVKLGNGNGPAVILGAHYDTNKNSVGADDDASGTAVVMEVARTLIESGITFKNPIYFMLFAAEEQENYNGSRAVAQDFRDKDLAVLGMLQYDQTGYSISGENVINLITNNTDKNLTQYVGKLLETYPKKYVYRTTCSPKNACSDYISWHDKQFPAAFVFEEDENPNFHKPSDTMDHLSLDHMMDFAKLGVAYVVELGEPIK